MGEYSPPDGHITFTAADLVELGLPTGSYTIRLEGTTKEARWARLDIR
jgi:hypothetical protein